MATARFTARQSRSARPWWRPVVYTAAAAAIAALFTPMPAFASPAAAPRLPLAPAVPGAPAAQAVPDPGSRPVAAGTLVMPGRQVSSPGTPTPTPTGVSSNPIVQKAEKGQAEIATLGDQLIQLGQERDLAKTQAEVAEAKHAKSQETLRQAQTAASDAAAAAMREAAAMPPGAFDPGLMGLDDLARIQRGDDSGQGAAARQLENAQLDEQLALDEKSLAAKRYSDLVTKYDKLNAEINKKEAAQQAYETAHANELNAAQAAENATDSTLASQYLSGAEAGRGADPRAKQALQFALGQIGKPYAWSEEGPASFDCSGLMWAAYRSVGVNLNRVSRDQYWQTRNKVVDRYSLLPGDLIFFSYTNSWQGIHHVAMYAGDGMMVEAPRTGLDVRLTKVRWSQMFQATRVLGSVEGVTEGPDLSGITPDDSNSAGGGSSTTKPPTRPPSKPPTSPTSKPPTTPTSKPPTSPTSKPPTTPTSKPPTSPTSKPPTSPTSKPPTSPTSKPPTSPTSKPPTTPTSKPPTSEPTQTPSTTPSPNSPSDPTTEPSGGVSSSSGGSPSTSSAEATESATKSPSPSESSSASPTGSK